MSDVAHNPQANPEASLTVALPNTGGTLTITTNLSFLNLRGAERELVFGILDLIRQFKATQPKEREP